MNILHQVNHVRQRGFSLIEVMIGVVILATGLLALSALQGSLARNAADSRIRSQVAAAMESAAEADRGSSNFSAVPATPSAVTIPGIGALTVAILDCSYTNLTDTSKSDPDDCVNLGSTAQDAQYKQVRYRASWTDATGGSRSMTLTSIVSPRTIANNSPLPFSTPTQGVSSIAPIVRTPNPEVAGMIPIAIGDGSDTAATNPKPNIVSGNVIRTSYEVLTYRDEGSNIVKQQRRVETAVVGCSCRGGSSATGAQFERPQWPTYWDGTRYAIYTPAGAASVPGSTQTAIGTPGATQDLLCTECCRDHHDTAGTTDVKFDPYRSDAHNHYKLVGSTLTQASGTDDYLEVCRMIRVDGFWRTAQDLSAKHFGLLATESNAQSPAPLGTAVTSYETFVIDYLRANYLPGQTAQTAATLFTSAGLSDSPARIDISKPTPADERYLHSRGLYVDKVEPVTQAKIANAAANCTRVNAVECILPLLAFTSINLTEPAFWSVQDTNQLTVDTDGFVFFNTSAPNRGRVNAKSTATAAAESNVTSAVTQSNAGVAARGRGIDPEDDVSVSDQQLFRIAGTGSGTGTGAYFNVLLSGLGTPNKSPAVSWGIGTNAAGCQGSAPYRCEPSVALSGQVSVTVSAYNQQEDRGGSLAVVCPSTGQTYTYSPNGQGTVRVCKNFGVSSATIGATSGSIQTAVNPGKVGSLTTGAGSEATAINFAGISSGQQVSIGFTLESETAAPVLTCTFGNGANSNQLKTVTFGTCP